MAIEFKKLVDEGKILIKQDTPILRSLLEKSLEEASKTQIEKTKAFEDAFDDYCREQHLEIAGGENEIIRDSNIDWDDDVSEATFVSKRARREDCDDFYYIIRSFDLWNDVELMILDLK